MTLSFATVDVFTDRQFGGNPLAVVTDARGLSPEAMQAIAAEFNLSETTFVLPPKDGGNTAEVRIFTPKAELPFAGHPNVGTAFVLARTGAVHGRPIAGDRLAFEEKAGLVHMDLIKDGSGVVGARLASPQGLVVGRDVPANVVAAACTLSPDEIAVAAHSPRIASCGVGFVFAELKSRAALAAAEPRPDVFKADLPLTAANGVHLYVRERDDHADVQTRMFAPTHGIQEDPATGSANVALVGLLAHLDPKPDLDLTITIAQGVDMGRPSLMSAAAEKREGTVRATWIGGRCVPVMTGAIDLR